MNVVLPQELEHAVKEKIASGRYHSAEELVTEAVSRLIEEQDTAPRDLSWLEKELQAGLDSPAREMTEADWEQLRQRITPGERVVAATMARLLVREQAWSDLEELGALIAKDNPAAATEVVRQLRLSFEQLSRMPQLGRIVRKIKTIEELRVWLFARVSQLPDLYRQLPDGVEIVRVLHGACDIKRILENE
jgi:toxin ParE1/3/4